MMFSGFSSNVLKQFEPMFSQMGVTAVQGGASAGNLSAKPAAGWEKSLNPGEAISGVLVSGDMSATGMGTVTYNDGKRILAFGHPFYNLGPIDMPMAKSEIMMVFSSSYQPTKFGSATEVVGALKQDRYTGIMGELGAEAPTVPVHVRVRSLGPGGVGDRTEGFELQRVRASEVDSAADEHDAGEFAAGDERVRGRDHLPGQRRRATGRQPETPCFDGTDRQRRHGAACL